MELYEEVWTILLKLVFMQYDVLFKLIILQTASTVGASLPSTQDLLPAGSCPLEREGAVLCPQLALCLAHSKSSPALDFLPPTALHFIYGIRGLKLEIPTKGIWSLRVACMNSR